ncbi:MAG: thioredoxin fold domain-containing protein [candidate division KSB1 bacterium]|nr:thioredoxin fold domain-containing protein [candidate division KSB1 bacterium]
MKRHHSPCIVALAALGLIGFTTPSQPSDDKPKKEQIAWLSFEQGLAVSKKEKKMLVVDFYTDWCGWCKVMDRETYGNASVIKFAREKLVFVKVNAESDAKTKFRDREYTYRELARAFGVTGYPATAFIDSSGDVITLVPGYVPPDKFLPVLEYLEGGHYKNMKFDEFVEKKK